MYSVSLLNFDSLLRCLTLLLMYSVFVLNFSYASVLLSLLITYARCSRFPASVRRSHRAFVRYLATLRAFYSSSFLIRTLQGQFRLYLLSYLRTCYERYSAGACTTTRILPPTPTSIQVPFVSYITAEDSDDEPPPLVSASTSATNSPIPNSPILSHSISDFFSSAAESSDEILQDNEPQSSESRKLEPSPSIYGNFRHVPELQLELQSRTSSQMDLSENSDPLESSEDDKVLAAYKRVDKKVKPVPGVFPQEARVIRNIPEDPLLTLPPLSPHPPNFIPTDHITQERLDLIKVNPDGFLWPEEEKLFIQVIMNNEKALAFQETDRGTLKDSYFTPYIMATIPHVPWEEKNIPIPGGKRVEIINLLKDKINAGVYEQSQSSYRSKWFCVEKKATGKLRIVHNLQALNAVSIRDAGLPPILDDFVEPFAGRQCYSVFDLFWGFDARKLDPASRDMTAFLTPIGQLRLTSMPMGYTNSPAEFQQCMVFILRPEIPDVANIFIDDVPVKGPATQYLDDEGNPETIPENPGIRRFIWEHAVDVNRVIHRIKEAGATFSAKKTQLCRPEVTIIGQTCTPEGRVIQDGKVQKILNWPVPTTPKEARGFMGLCGGVRIWIKNYSLLSRPITELWRKDFEFEWNERRQEAFDAMKLAVSSAPALRPIDYESDLPVILSVDTSFKAIGFILSQIDENGKRRPARYGSIPLNDRESRYSQAKLELYGLFRALRAYRLYLIGVKKLIVEVDASYIKGMLNEPDTQPNASMNRWIQGILMFDFTLVHVPGSKHVGPDALSRRELGEGEEIVSDDDEWLDDIALFAQEMNNSPSHLPPALALAISAEERNLFNIFKFLKTFSPPEFPSLQEKKRFLTRATRYFVKGPKLWKRGNPTPLQVVFEEALREKILTEAHENFGHRGVQAVFETIRRRYYWPHLYAYVKHHVATCHQCQIRSTKRVELPPTISAPATVFSKVYIDVMLMPAAKGYRYIVAARDDLSRAAEGRALQRANATTLAKFFWEEIYCRYGMIQQVVTDNGPEVKGAFDLLLKKLDIPHVKISPYNSKANGVVERGHFTIREAITKSCGDKIQNWPDKVPLAFFADKIQTSSVTGYSPYFLLYGVHPVLPLDLTEATFMVEGFEEGMSSADLLALRIRQLERHPEDIERAAKRLKEARLRSKAQFERRYHKKIRRKIYSRGDPVLIRNTMVEKELNRKTKPRYLGPFLVDRRTRGGSYVLKEMNGVFMRQGVAAFRLYPYLARNTRKLYALGDASDSEKETASSSSEDDL